MGNTIVQVLCKKNKKRSMLFTVKMTVAWTHWRYGVMIGNVYLSNLEFINKSDEGRIQKHGVLPTPRLTEADTPNNTDVARRPLLFDLRGAHLRTTRLDSSVNGYETIPSEGSSRSETSSEGSTSSTSDTE